jgi:hypothetical protein
MHDHRDPERSTDFALLEHLIMTADTLLVLPAEQAPFPTTASLIALSERFPCGSVDVDLTG